VYFCLLCVDTLNSTSYYILKFSVPFSEYFKDFNAKIILPLKINTLCFTFTVFLKPVHRSNKWRVDNRVLRSRHWKSATWSVCCGCSTQLYESNGKRRRNITSARAGNVKRILHLNSCECFRVSDLVLVALSTEQLKNFIRREILTEDQFENFSSRSMKICLVFCFSTPGVFKSSLRAIFEGVFEKNASVGAQYRRN